MIFYFTATGNSKFIAEKLAQKTGDNIINVADCVRNGKFDFELSEGESLGIVFPIYFLGVPIIISEFLQKLKLSGKKDFYSYVIMNCGGQTGNTEKLLKRLFGFNAVYGIKAPDNYVPMYKTGSDEVKNKQLDKTEADIAVIAEHINKKEPGRFNPYRGILPRILSAIVYPIFLRGRKTKKFTVSSDCLGCGLCKSICPRGVIEIKDGKPVWTAVQCETCLACLHRCPTAAINYGKKSANNGRYINPRVEL